MQNLDGFYESLEKFIMVDSLEACLGSPNRYIDICFDSYLQNATDINPHTLMKERQMFPSLILKISASIRHCSCLSENNRKQRQV